MGMGWDTVGWGWDGMGWDGIEIGLKYIAQYAQYATKQKVPHSKSKIPPLSVIWCGLSVCVCVCVCVRRL